LRPRRSACADQFKIVAADVAVIVVFGRPTSGTIGAHV
jgi:hypothetical protein